MSENNGGKSPISNPVVLLLLLVVSLVLLGCCGAISVQNAAILICVGFCFMAIVAMTELSHSPEVNGS